MAISLVDRMQIRTAGAASVSGSFTTAPAAGDVVAVMSNHYSTTFNVTASDNKSNTYTVRVSTNNGNWRGRGYTAPVVTGGATFTVTITEPDIDSLTSEVEAWRTSTGTLAFDVAASATGTSTAPSVASGTLANATAVVMACTGHASPDATQTEPGAPWTLALDEEDYLNYTDQNVVYQVVASTASVTATWTDSASAAWFAYSLALSATSGGGGSAVPIQGASSRPFPFKPGSPASRNQPYR